LRGGDGSDFLDGGDGDDILKGGAGDDWLAGGAGDDMLDGGQGDDILFGGTGQDLFVFSGGADVIMDFEDGDLLQISKSVGGQAIESLDSLTDFAIDLDGSTLLDFGNGDSVLLNGVSYDSLAAEPGKFISLV